jgi:hypothetical protein
MQAYGSHLHVVHTNEGDLFVTDTCCSGGLPPVDAPFGLVEEESLLTLPGQRR